MIVTGGIPAVMAVKASGTRIPVIFYMGGDAVGLGLVASLNRPGRNFSGATVLNTELVPKRLEMLHELVPAASSFAVLLNPSNRNAEGQWRDLQEAARGRRLQLHRLHASNDHEIDAALASLPRLNTGGLVIGADGMFVAQGERIAALTVRHVVPAIFQLPEFAAAGGLVSYAGSMTDVRWGHTLAVCSKANGPPRRREHREIPDASYSPPDTGDDIVSAQTATLIGAETGFATAI